MIKWKRDLRYFRVLNGNKMEDVSKYISAFCVKYNIEMEHTSEGIHMVSTEEDFLILKLAHPNVILYVIED